MTADQHVRQYIDQLLADFRAGFEPFVITVLKTTHGADWFTVLRNTPDLRVPPDARNLQLDATGLVRIILAHWDSTFGRVLSHTDRSHLHEIRYVRNRWAHQATIPIDDVDRLADNVIRLLTSISAEHTDKVITQREAFRLERYAPLAAQKAWRSPAVWIAAICIGLVCTISIGYGLLSLTDTVSADTPIATASRTLDGTVAAESVIPVVETVTLVIPKSLALTASPVPAANLTFTASDSFPCQVGQIKGNGRTKIFHVPSGMYYIQTRNSSVVCFESVDAALQAGYRASKR